MKTLERIHRGLPILRAIKDKVNEIVDYLRATKLVQGPGILLKESSSGLVISVNGSARAKDDEDVYAFVTAGPGVLISGTSETPAVSGSTNSTVPLAGATFSLLLEAGTDNVTITDGEGGSKVISVTGNTESARNFPDYIALSTTPAGLPAPTSENGIGLTFLKPVHAGVPIKYEAPNGLECLVLFAESVEGTTDSMGGTVIQLAGGSFYTPNADGHVRFSILDDGLHTGDCVRLFVGTNDWSKALPVYRCGAFSNVSGITSSVSGGTAAITLTGGTTSSVKIVGNGAITVSGNNQGEIVLTAATGATAIGSSISGGTVTISLTAATGSVKFKAGNNVSITGSNGVYTISASGGGGGSFDAPDWQNHQGSDTPGGMITHLIYISGGSATGGYLKTHGSFSTPCSGWIYCFAELRGCSTYQAVHVNVNGALFKVASVLSSEGTTVGGSVGPFPVMSGKSVSIHQVNLTSYATVGCVFYADSASD